MRGIPKRGTSRRKNRSVTPAYSLWTLGHGNRFFIYFHFCAIIKYIFPRRYPFDKGTKEQEVKMSKEAGMARKGYEKLIVWQKADELAYQVYLETRRFPKEELYGITSQVRRASISIPTNIAEGTGRQGRNELRQFVNISLGSMAEVSYLLGFCRRLGYLNESRYNLLEGLRVEVWALLWRFYQSLV